MTFPCEPVSCEIVGYLILLPKYFIKAAVPPGNSGMTSTLTWIMSSTTVSVSTTGGIQITSWTAFISSDTVETLSVTSILFSTISNNSVTLVSGGGGGSSFSSGNVIGTSSVTKMDSSSGDSAATLTSCCVHSNETNMKASATTKPINNQEPRWFSIAAFFDFLASIKNVFK